MPGLVYTLLSVAGAADHIQTLNFQGLPPQAFVFYVYFLFKYLPGFLMLEFMRVFQFRIYWSELSALILKFLCCVLTFVNKA